MKLIAIAALILILFPFVSYSKDTDPEELLEKVDVSHPYYGNTEYGGHKADIFHSKDKSILLVYQARYGGEGDSTENLLKLFKFQNNKGKKLLDQNIDSVEFIQDNGILKQIKGKYVATLCNVCDGWEVSEPEDIFFVPIVIDVESLTVKSTLSEKEKKDLLSRLEKQADKDVAEQVRVEKPSPAHDAPLAFSNTQYLDYVSNIKKQIKELLERK
jgi:hypothetical protein